MNLERTMLSAGSSTFSLVSKKKIGQGASGEVWLSKRIEDCALAAIKILRSDASRDEISRFRREVQLLASLHHPHIVPILASQVERPPFWYAMPFYKTSLAAELPWLIGDSTRVPVVFDMILDAVAYAHSRGVIHRDLKPANVLMSDHAGFASGVPALVVSDFGLGRDVSSGLAGQTASEVVVGTLAYMAPEQMLAAKHATIRSDIFSLGRILYELYTGPLDQVPRRIPAGVYRVVRRATQLIPEDRYRTVKEMKRAWSRIVNQGMTSFEYERIEELPRILRYSFPEMESEEVEALRERCLAELAELLSKRLRYHEQLHRVIRTLDWHALADMYAQRPDFVRQMVEELVRSVREGTRPGDDRWVGPVFQNLLSGIPDSELRAALIDCAMDQRARIWKSRQMLIMRTRPPDDAIVAESLWRQWDMPGIKRLASYLGNLNNIAPAIRTLLEEAQKLEDPPPDLTADGASAGDDFLVDDDSASEFPADIMTAYGSAVAFPAAIMAAYASAADDFPVDYDSAGDFPGVDDPASDFSGGDDSDIPF